LGRDAEALGADRAGAVAAEPAADRLDHLLRALLRDERTDEQVTEARYLATLARLPTPGGRRHVAKHLASQADRAAALRNVLWALTNSTEFSANLEALLRRDPRRVAK
jgi:hypothetical protein